MSTATAAPTASGGQEALDVPLAFGPWNLDQVALFTEYARDQDVIGERSPLNLLADVEIGRKALVLGSRDEPITADSSVLREAKEIGITILAYNLETATDRDELVRREMSVQAAAKEHGLFYCFAPTPAKLLRHYDDFALHADCLILQAQAFQTTEEYESVVEGMIERIKSVNPDVKVWVQVSVNPRGNPDISADEVIDDIQLIADKADLIWIYFHPTKASTLEEVFTRLRQ